MMKLRLMLVVLGMFMTAVVTSAVADLTIEGRSASGNSGTRVFLELAYDYESGLDITVENLQFFYPREFLDFLPEFSTINLSSVQSLPQYVQQLGQFALSDPFGGSASAVHSDAGVDRKSYTLSFFTSSVGQPRSGLVSLKLAFDVHQNAPAGTYPVLFPQDTNVLADEAANEYYFPSTLQSLNIEVSPVPEPKIALMLLPGLALIVLYVRLRGARRERPRDGRIDC